MAIGLDSVPVRGWGALATWNWCVDVAGDASEVVPSVAMVPDTIVVVAEPGS